MMTKTAKLHRHDDGRIHAKSADGHTIYDVTIGERTSCSCPGFVHHGHCYHSTDAAQRYAAMWSVPPSLRLPANVVRFPVRTLPELEPTPPAASKRKASVADLYGPDEVA